MIRFLRNIGFIVFLSVLIPLYTEANNPEPIDSPYFKVYLDSAIVKAYPNLVFVIWDSINLNPYRKIDVQNKTDSTILTLVDQDSRYTPPVKGKITSGYGYRGGHYHPALDIDLEYGDSVLNVFNGVVRVSAYYKGYGNYIIVTHDNGLESLYAHLSKRLVCCGQAVKSGEVLGLGGATGRASGTHLHFEVRFMGYPLNPTKIIDFNNYCLIANCYTICCETFGSVSGTVSKPVASSGSGYHVVKSGDTLYRISKLYGVPIETLCALNHISKTTLLQLGWKIKY